MSELRNDSDLTTDGVEALTLYTTSWCPFCTRLKKLLDEKAIGYVEIDVDADAEAAAFVESVNGGNRVVPTALYSDGTTATNPPASQVRAKLAELADA
ncbi:glutaredoxin-like protein [Dietzia natronolimnaea]|uniref:Glutaredoxin-like protein n=1 Tax=Dietzia natronolimnaea TaxID=161920 RepID=A0A2A2WMC5_9ACTN|nr:mycoredoxin [Dietzia natronolimnaea]PAY22331.1 glutaredoxin-like protein [Dietzia natronolimnaea]